MDREVAHIAERIRRYRTDEGLTLQELGERAGVSASTIHKIENGQTVPTITVLLKVAHGLRRPPADLFEGAPGDDAARVVRQGEALRFPVQPGTRVDRITGGIPRARIDLWRVRHAPGRGAGQKEPLRYAGELVILVEEGRLEVEVDGQPFTLDPGDTLHFETHHPHRWRSAGSSPMSALFFGTLTSGFGVPSSP